MAEAAWVGRVAARLATKSAKWLAAGVVALAAPLLLWAWAVSAPVGSGPDDDVHLASIWCRSSAAADSCRPVGATTDYGVSEVAIDAYPNIACYAFNRQQDASCLTEGPVEVRYSDTLAPPLFYEFSALFAGDTASAGVVSTRLVTGGVALALLAAAYAVTFSWLRPALLVSWVVMSMPLGVSLLASNNPASWAIAGIAALWGPMVTALLADRTAVSPTVTVSQDGSRAPRVWWASGVWLLAAVLASGSRADAAIYVGFISALGLALLWRRRTQLVPAVIAGIAALVVAAAFFGSSGQSRFASGSFSDEFTPRDPGEVRWSLFESSAGFLGGILGAPWGAGNSPGTLGWLDVSVPNGVWLPMVAVASVLAVLGLGQMWPRKAVALAALGLVMAVVPARSLLQAGALPGELFQPRYLLPLALVVFGVLLGVRRGRPLALAPLQLAVLALGLIYAGTLALHAWIRRWITGQDVRAMDLTTTANWWPSGIPSPNTVWFLGSVAWSVLVIVMLAHLWPNVLADPAARRSDDHAIPART